jgi:hypothetical protein
MRLCERLAQGPERHPHQHQVLEEELSGIAGEYREPVGEGGDDSRCGEQEAQRAQEQYDREGAA